MIKYAYYSVFKVIINEYIEEKRNHGFKFHDGAYMMKRFDSFLVNEKVNDVLITRELIEKWAIQSPTESKSTRNARVSAVRQFCKYCVSIDIVAYIPRAYGNNKKTIPYVLSYSEIESLFKFVDTYRANSLDRYKHFNYLIPIVYRLYYCCGLRNSEVCQLKHDSIIHEKKALKIIAPKNKNDRVVFLDNEVYTLLMKYVDVIQMIKPSIWLFPAFNSLNPIDKTLVTKYFHNIIKLVKIGTEDYYPTVHSLRHTYVVHKIDNWIEEGVNTNIMMPYLSQQLGHSSVNETFYYYHFLDTSLKPIRVVKSNVNIYPEVVAYEE